MKENEGKATTGTEELNNMESHSLIEIEKKRIGEQAGCTMWTEFLTKDKEMRQWSIHRPL